LSAVPPLHKVAVIPARLASTRLPEKVLLRETGKYLIEHVWERVRRVALLDRVVIATDHPRVFEAVQSFGGDVVLTSPEHRSGTDRVAEVVRVLPDADLVVNVQGDEPQIEPLDVEALVRSLEGDPECSIATLVTPIANERDLLAASVVKAVLDSAGRVLYFSRSPIPHGACVGAQPPEAFKHRGIYAYRRRTLLELAALPPADLERVERLEQLRWLDAGHRIRAVVTPRDGIGIDTAEDYRRFVQGAAR
jgi:3-deoxy-manno-octulosonate cytidylyltransferase (CMP-KDO synthetase)